MNRAAQGVLVMMLGGVLLCISAFSDVYLRYVKAGLRWPLVLAGSLLVVAGVLALIGEVRSEQERSDGHHHHGGPWVAWLLSLPVFAIVLVAPPSLGSYSAERTGAAAVSKPSADYPPLPAGDPVTISLLDYVSRAVWDHGRSLRGRTVRMTGFVTTGPGGTVYLTRLVLFCCAADAQTLRIVLHGYAPAPLSPDDWITVTGQYRSTLTKDPVSSEWIPVLAVRSLQRVGAPTEPYDT